MRQTLGWFARISGAAVTVFFLSGLFVADPGVGVSGKGFGMMGYLLLCMPSFAGYLLGWFKPYAGGLLMVFGALLLTGAFLMNAGLESALIHGTPSLLIGLAYIASSRHVLL